MRVKKLMLSALTSVAPRTAIAVQAARSRAHSHRMVRQWGLTALNARLLSQVGSVVRSGPFEGMTLGSMSHAEHVGPFILGTYEHELHGWLATLTSQRFNQVLDVGAKFGYYAVGMARCLPDADVVAVDPDPWARRAVREMAALNGASRVRTQSLCDPAWLGLHLRPGALVISDCEGYEHHLFTQSTAPTLDTATLLIETHDGLSPGTTRDLHARFESTHVVESIESSDRVPAAPVSLTGFTDAEIERLCKEIRGPQEWMLLRPKRRQ